MYHSLVRAFATAVAGSAMLVACGGGSADTPTTAGGNTNTAGNSGVNTPPPVALPTTVISSVFNGKTDANQPVTTLLQDDGSYFMVYSSATTAQNFLGVVLGTGTLVNGSFSSTNGLDVSFGGEGVPPSNPTTLSASYTQKQSLNGTVTYTLGGQAKSFTSGYNSQYETLPSLASLAGVYVGSIATKNVREDNITLTISSDGALSGNLTCGCSVAARLVPRTDGKAYDATLAFSEGTHPLTGKSFAGNVYLDATSKRLYIVGKLSNSTDLAVFVANKT
jgi:hypothetical protein